MTIHELHTKLLNAYTVENLNRISLTLIELYKNQQFSILRKIAEIISDSVQIEISTQGKGFSKFMMLYHPDRCSIQTNEINQLAEQSNYEKLLGFSHILLLARIDEIASSLNSYEDVDYSPVYEWDFSSKGFTVVDNLEEKESYNTATEGCDFYTAIKKRVFENMDIEFPYYYLEDMDELELSSSAIDNLEGAEYCIHVKNFDLSDNFISDLEPLSGLSFLEELNVSDNQVENIDALSNLVGLKNLYLSNNNIRDLSPLFELENLEFVDVIGNNIDQNQIQELLSMGINVDY